MFSAACYMHITYTQTGISNYRNLLVILAR